MPLAVFAMTSNVTFQIQTSDVHIATQAEGKNRLFVPYKMTRFQWKYK